MAKSMRGPKPAPAVGKTNRPPRKTVKKLAVETKAPLDLEKQLEEILEHGKDLFRSKEECEQFLAAIYERRHRAPGIGRSAFFQHRTVDEIAAEQGKGPVTDLDALLGMGKDLWKSDAEFEEFLAGIYERRRQGQTR